MRIGIDIDGVLTDYESFAFDYFSKYCFENNINYHIDNSKYEIKDTFNIDKILEKNFWNKHMQFYANDYKARPFASEVIKNLRKAGNEIYIVTARTYTNLSNIKGQNMRLTVENWLDANEIEYDKILYCKRPTYNKINEVKENNIDIMIEDSPKNILALKELIPVICYHSEYNKHINAKNVTRCYSWYDIYRELTK